MLLRTIIFTGAVQGIFQILLLRAKQKNHTADYWLMAWLFLVSLQLFFYYANFSLTKSVFSINHQFTIITGIIAFSIPLLTAPVLFQYIQALITGQKPTVSLLFAYFLPWCAYLAVALNISQFEPYGIIIRAGYPHFATGTPESVTALFSYPLAFIPGIYAILGLISLIRYQKSLPDQYSYTERINLNWLKWLVISILLLFIFLFGFIRLGTQQHLVDQENLFLYVGFVLSMYVFLIGYLGLRQNTLLLAEKDVSPETPSLSSIPYQKTGLDTASVELIYKRLLTLMEEEKPYLKEDLSLAMLAQQLALNSNQLSQVINQQSQRNFFSFVNRYRVEAVKLKLRDSAFAHLSILGIAYDCGFRSKSAFNRIFREHTGMSPITYQRQVKEQL
jgi:AraC-like DNA-binding protein